MTNEEKAKEIVQGVIHDRGCIDMVTDQAIYNGAMTMAQWKDLENRWHKISDGDFPKVTGDYLTVCRNKNKEDGIFIYEVVYYTGDEWDENRINYEDIIAWREVPKYEEQTMINKNDALILKCIMKLNHCDMVSAIKFAEHNQTCYNLARAVANAKDEDFKAEKQALIDKACEWWENELTYPTMTQAEIDDFVLGRIKEFKQAMKGE